MDTLKAQIAEEILCILEELIEEEAFYCDNVAQSAREVLQQYSNRLKEAEK